MQTLIDEIYSAFPLERGDAISIEAAYEFYTREKIGRSIENWSQITEEDLNSGHFAGILHMLTDQTLVYWLPAWLSNIAVYQEAVPRALGAFGACFSTEISESLGRSELLHMRALWLDRRQKLAVAGVGRLLIGNKVMLDLFQFDVGAAIAEAWERRAAEGYSA